MARNQNTFAKLQRERIKKEKAEEKRKRRQQRKEGTGASDSPEHSDASLDLPSEPISPDTTN